MCFWYYFHFDWFKMYPILAQDAMVWRDFFCDSNPPSTWSKFTPGGCGSLQWRGSFSKLQCQGMAGAVHALTFSHLKKWMLEYFRPSSLGFGQGASTATYGRHVGGCSLCGSCGASGWFQWWFGSHRSPKQRASKCPTRNGDALLPTRQHRGLVIKKGSIFRLL